VDWAEGIIHVRDAKTKAGVREVVLMPALQQILADHSLKNDTTLVFETKRGKRIEHSSVRRDALYPALKKAGVTKRIRFHDLRHTYASILIDQGHPETFICEQMGHANPAITRRIYGHLFDRDKRREDARSKLEAAFGQVLGKQVVAD
jgi:integrase